LEGQTVEDLRAYCKLTIGVPILRAEDETFREKYDAVVRPLSYEKKIALMKEPLDFPVTRLMSTRQATAYLEGIHRHFSEQGLALTDPGDLLRNYQPVSASSADGTGSGETVPSSPAADPVPAAADPEAGAIEADHPDTAAPASVLSPDDKAFLVRVFKTMKAAVGPEVNVLKRQALLFTDEIGGKSDLVRAKAKTIREQLQECCGDAPAKGTVAVARYVAGIIGVDERELGE
jgi:hypothetical protein